MAFLVDTDICSAYLKGDRRLYGRFMQYGGGVHVSVVTEAELWAWVGRAKVAEHRREGVRDLMRMATRLPLDEVVAQRAGAERAALLDQGAVVPTVDMLIAATALVHDLTMVTHNVLHFKRVPGLRVIDWLSEN